MVYDLIIVGGGPGGLSAGIYAVRYGLNTLVLEKGFVSGQIATTGEVENYPGFPSISGMDLMDKFSEHAKAAGVAVESREILGIRSEGDRKIISTDSGDLETLSVIIATGANPRHLGVPGEKEFRGKGVSYCATCDGPFFKGRNVIVVGGGESALTDVLILSNIAASVCVVHRRDTLRASQILQDRAFAKPNVEFSWNTVLEEIIGDSVVREVVLRNTVTDEVWRTPIDGIFIYVGIEPNTEFVDVEKDASGFIITDERMATSVDGIFAVGDCRAGILRQVITAVSDGSIAAFGAYEYVSNMKHKSE
ncbi:thioredoxin-disulfide reductase [Methanococcoides orientis]|uniref:thioredoxin-disulfide reductase n=1 Tax=Methanococcoides orientis TaxID=2822137 RepID=UPI001E450620|nr:thioredoxin-disulfide reductase [Methanococcoides orientis]UGV41044.1 thioredoxin-disulfide reductase [Methanococcoides orientis]